MPVTVRNIKSVIDYDPNADLMFLTVTGIKIVINDIFNVLTVTEIRIVINDRFTVRTLNLS
jgi:hypothetical protein